MDNTKSSCSTFNVHRQKSRSCIPDWNYAVTVYFKISLSWNGMNKTLWSYSMKACGHNYRIIDSTTPDSYWTCYRVWPVVPERRLLTIRTFPSVSSGALAGSSSVPCTDPGCWSNPRRPRQFRHPPGRPAPWPSHPDRDAPSLSNMPPARYRSRKTFHVLHTRPRSRPPEFLYRDVITAQKLSSAHRSICRWT